YRPPWPYLDSALLTVFLNRQPVLCSEGTGTPPGTDRKNGSGMPGIPVQLIGLGVGVSSRVLGVASGRALATRSLRAWMVFRVAPLRAAKTVVDLRFVGVQGAVDGAFVSSLTWFCGAEHLGSGVVAVRDHGRGEGVDAPTRPEEVGQGTQENHNGDPVVQAQPRDVVGRVHPHVFDPRAAQAVPHDVEREQTTALERAFEAPPQVGEQYRQAQAPQGLVEEGRVVGEDTRLHAGRAEGHTSELQSRLE